MSGRKKGKKSAYSKPGIRSLGKVKGLTRGGWGGWGGGWHGGHTRPCGGDQRPYGS